MIDRDGSPGANKTIAMWNPPITDPDTASRRSPLTEAAELLAKLVVEGARTIVFMKSRKAVELMAHFAKRNLEDMGHPDLAKRIAPYRAGYTSMQRRELEHQLQAESCSASSPPTRSSSASTSARSTPRSA